MRILAVIPARGGSKRVPGKNIRLLGDRPLIVWSIDVAKQIPEICNLIVSTDDAAIAKIATDAGASCPWLRPPELATDTATSVDVCLHALDWFESVSGSVDALMLLQPTSPFRRPETMMRGIEIFRTHQLRPVVALSPAQSHPIWCYRIDNGRLSPFVERGGVEVRSQDLPAAYVINGAFYIIAPDDLRKNRSFLGPDMLPLVTTDPEGAIDIDTERDWELAEFSLKSISSS